MEWRPHRWGGKGVITAREEEGGAGSLQHIPLSTQGYEADEGRGTGYNGQSQPKRETRTAGPGVVGGLVRYLMATERARILGRKAIDLGRYTLEKRAQRWRESKPRSK